MNSMKSIRLIHFTDIHYTSNSLLDIARADPALKRVFGWVNFNLMGRTNDFANSARSRILEDINKLSREIKQSPGKQGAVIFTGDATSMSLKSEFEQAHENMSTVLDVIPSLAIPGNHDIYTKHSLETQSFQKYFGKWSHKDQGTLSQLSVGNVNIVGLETCRPRTFDSTGYISEEQLSGFKTILDQGHEKLILAIHYPLLDPSKTPLGVVNKGYQDAKPKHCIENGLALMELIESSHYKPLMIIHGHIHKPSLSLWNNITISNPGCSALTRGSFSLYDIEENHIHITNQLYNHETDSFDSEKFTIETGVPVNST